MKNIQLPDLFAAFDTLQHIHGDPMLHPVYGAGCTKRPKVFLLFMNPTGKNVSCTKERKGIRAPRLGTKNIWKLLAAIGAISETTRERIHHMKPNERTEKFSLAVYTEIADNDFYISNLAKCTQTDARPLKDSVFKEYLDLVYEEIDHIQPQHIVSFGNQVSSLVLSKKITVSAYTQNEHELLHIKKHTYTVYPTFYPVGQGMRNLPKAIDKIQYIINSVV